MSDPGKRIDAFAAAWDSGPVHRAFGAATAGLESAHAPRTSPAVVANLFADDFWVDHLLDGLADALRDDPYFEPPFRSISSDIHNGLVVFEDDHVSIAAGVTRAAQLAAKKTGCSAAALDRLFRAAHSLQIRQGGRRPSLVLGMPAYHRRFQRRDCGPLRPHRRARSIEDGDIVVVDGRHQSFVIEHARANLVVLQATVKPDRAPLAVEYDSESLRLCRLQRRRRQRLADPDDLDPAAQARLRRRLSGDRRLSRPSELLRALACDEGVARPRRPGGAAASQEDGGARSPSRGAARRPRGARPASKGAKPRGRPPDGPRHPCAEDEKPIALGDLVQALNDEAFDPADEESFAAAAPLAQGLANNRDFLAEIAIAELKDRCTRQSLENRYSSQVIMLHRASEKYFIRANFWPSERDSVFKASGTSPFFYHVPHDHNFSFLTVGYLGPGYWSEYYEYDYEKVVGVPGEKVDLRFIEKAKLDQGKVMLYRAHKDVHNQLPADEMSVSINIMEASNRLPFLSQYQFDVKRCEIAGDPHQDLDRGAARAGRQSCGGNGRDLVESFADRHPCDRIQFAALRELAAAESDVDAGLERLGRGHGVRRRLRGGDERAGSGADRAPTGAGSSVSRAPRGSARRRRCAFPRSGPARPSRSHQDHLRRSAPALPWRHRASPRAGSRATARSRRRFDSGIDSKSCSSREDSLPLTVNLSAQLPLIWINIQRDFSSAQGFAKLEA